MPGDSPRAGEGQELDQEQLQKTRELGIIHAGVGLCPVFAVPCCVLHCIRKYTAVQSQRKEPGMAMVSLEIVFCLILLKHEARVPFRLQSLWLAEAWLQAWKSGIFYFDVEYRAVTWCQPAAR